jgi:hypothetical protein
VTRYYFELRKARGGSLINDMMRHLHTRQHLGKAVIVCEQPSACIAAARKQWLKLARSVQNKRAATVSADKILKYTHTVTHMQNMRFTTQAPLEKPDADVYFMKPAEVNGLPPQCYGVYLALTLTDDQIGCLLAQLPDQALIVDYEQATPWDKLGLTPRSVLEQNVTHEWQQIKHFLSTYRIDIKELGEGQLKTVEAMEEALDILLGASHKFLQIAHDFQRALELARPLKLSRELRQQYDAASLLAHRVQALSPGAFTRSFLETYNEDDTFFLYDPARERSLPFGESLAESIARHLEAGRVNLAEALRNAYGTTG